ncbi:peptidoglycan/LPS O-acetylase OafA/YrhL [Actinocrispum wychmicini]|uniref:Peptidoglycan/LPS O-acetylase OafA/YrhL n=1 Tax=Actinocrispum wychmicini TaxID=1213861 RepID=A0A4R2J3L3_9PSEU|nr:peptidoglycan/LPS O-acetylase OafA/YrhL [Actinocrispum wychmicini]
MTTTLSATKPAPARSARRISWDILRVFAVFCVVVEHVTHQSAVNHPELAGYPFVLPFQFGASTMLVISAFFVCVTVGKGRPGSWLWNRIARLLPAYFVAVLVTYVITRLAVTAFNGLHFSDGDWLFGTPTASNPWLFNTWNLPTGQDLLGNLLMVQAWDPSLHWVDPSYWTLPIQLVAFACAAFLARHKLMTSRRVPVLLWSLVIMPIFLRFFVRDPGPQWIKSIFDGLALNRVALFGVGIAIWLWSKRRMRFWHLAGYILAALVSLDWHTYWTDTSSTIAVGIVLIFVVFAAGGPDWNIPVVRRMTPTITWLAGISYGVYLTHQVLGYILSRALLDIGARPWERLVASLIAAVVLGWLMTRLVERPAHRFLSDAGPRMVAWIRRAQIHAGRLGTSPARPVPSPRPVSQASTVVAGPPTSGESLPSMLPANSQSR